MTNKVFRVNITVLSNITLLCYFCIYNWGKTMTARKIHDSETKKHLIECAKAEFMEKGFAGASLEISVRKQELQPELYISFFMIKMICFVK